MLALNEATPQRRHNLHIITGERARQSECQKNHLHRFMTSVSVLGIRVISMDESLTLQKAVARRTRQAETVTIRHKVIRLLSGNISQRPNSS